MKIPTAIRKASLWLLAVVLVAKIAAATAFAAAPALQGQVTLRPLTPQEIKDYGLGSLQRASGLNTIGLGQPAYLEALVNNAVPNADITNVTFTLTGKPVGSAAEIAASPLPSAMPTFKMADRINNSGAPVYKVAGRSLLKPDLRGSYVVTVTIQTASSGSTNVSQSITAGTYLGVNTCALCHSGGLGAPNMMTPWSQTAHAEVFTKGINGLSGAYTAENLPYHTAGYDAEAGAVNGGFDDVAQTIGWIFPTILNTNTYAAVPSPLKNLANVQCESCHGPGSEHAFSLGLTNLISKSYAVADCAQCHDKKDGTAIGNTVAEWNNSLHAHPTRTPSGANRNNCVRCHTAQGFKDFLAHANDPTPYVTNTVFEAITCAACHDPHDASKPYQLRAVNTYTLPEGTTITNAGFGALCMNCHHSRNGEVTQNIANYKLGKPTWANGSSFGVHDSTAGDMIEGVNAYTYGKTIPSGSHNAVIPNVCSGCHMQELPPDSPGYLKAGGHTFSMSYPIVSGGVTNTVDAVNVCIKCHGDIDTFNFARKDYDNDGQIEGVQTEVQNLLNKLSRLLPNSTYRADGAYVPDGLIKSPSVKTNWPTKYLQAAWNWQFVNVEGSKGVHNAPYAVGVLKASIADLTGDGNGDGLNDAWQVANFGSVSDPNAAPNASPAGDNIPNWLKFNLGLDPKVKGVNIPGGVIWVNGKNVVNSTDDAVAIYTAAELVFDTVVGTSYQIQSISALGGSWQDVGGPIAGTGTAISYVTPTRGGLQQFYRVVHTP